MYSRASAKRSECQRTSRSSPATQCTGRAGLLTRKGAVNADRGVMGIIPGSMGARSNITRGLGNADALKTSSHGAGRVMSRNVARKTITLEQHLAALQGVESRVDPDVLDESPAAYKIH